jgi:hypothetical protein
MPPSPYSRLIFRRYPNNAGILGFSDLTGFYLAACAIAVISSKARRKISGSFPIEL